MNNDGKEKEVEFITISAEKIDFGRNNFIEVGSEEGQDELGGGERVHLLITGLLRHGWQRWVQEKRAKFKKSVMIPDDPKVKEFVIERIKSLWST